MVFKIGTEKLHWKFCFATLKAVLSSASRGTKSAVAAVFEHISVNRAASIDTIIAIA